MRSVRRAGHHLERLGSDLPSLLAVQGHRALDPTAMIDRRRLLWVGVLVIVVAFAWAVTCDALSLGSGPSMFGGMLVGGVVIFTARGWWLRASR